MNVAARPFSWVLLAGCCAGWLGAAAPADAQQRPKVSFLGTEIFSNLLHQFGLRPLLKVSDLADADPQDTLVVVFGDPKALDALSVVTGGLANFQARGGALLLALDRNDRGRLQDFHVKVGRVPWYECSPETKQFAYRDDPQFIFINTYVGIRHPLFLGLKKGLATNHPCSLETEDSDLQKLCDFPEGRFVSEREIRLMDGGPMRDDPRPLPLEKPPHPFIVGTGSTSGPNDRVVILPGHSLFMNGLLAQDDNDNRAFSNNCIRWLTNLGARKKVLFILNDRVVTKLDLPMAQPPVPPVAVVNAVLHAVEKANVFNALLLNQVGAERLLRWEVAVGSAVLLVLACGTLLRGRLPSPLGPLLRPRVRALAEQPPLLVQRHRAVVRDGNLWEAARVLARQCFEGATLQPPPPAALRGDPAQRRRLDECVRRLWQLAYGPAARPVLLPEFARLLQDMERVRAARAEGTLSSEAGPPPTPPRP